MADLATFDPNVTPKKQPLLPEDRSNLGAGAGGANGPGAGGGDLYASPLSAGPGPGGQVAIDPSTGQPMNGAPPNPGPGGQVAVPPPAAPQPPAPTPAAPAAAPHDPTPQEAGAMGLGWVDRNNPNWGKPGFVGSTPESGGAPPATPTGDPDLRHAGGEGGDRLPPPPPDPTGDPTKNPVDLLRPPVNPDTPIAGAGSGGVNAADESNQQKMLRDALIAQMTQSKDVSVNDPNIKAQLDPYAAAQERARKEEVSRGAEQAFAGGQDYGSPERMAAAERSGQATGLRASDLVGREIQSKRDEIQKALTEFGGMMSEDQKNALQRRAQDLDAQLKREGIGADVYKTNKSYDIEKYKTDRGFDMDKMRLDADTIIKQAGLKQTGDLGNRELDIRDKLGMAGMNAQMTSMLLNDKQFRQKLGLDAGIAEADLNRQALSSLMG